MRLKPYFKSEPSDPQPLQIQIARRVRFEEVDCMGIVWHGRYASFLEDARIGLGDKWGIGYADFIGHGYATPIVRMVIDYINPLHFNEDFTITAQLHFTKAARINMSYTLKRGEQLISTAATVQLILSHSGELMLAAPDFYYDFCTKWQQQSKT